MKTLRELSDLRGRQALVVGGGGHLGSAAAEALGELGADVAVCDLDHAAAAAVAARLAGGEGRAVSLDVDLRDSDATRAAVDEAAAELGGLDVLVHAAALVGTSESAGWAVPFADQTPAAFEEALRVNLVSAFTLAQAAQSLLAASGRGAIVLFGSIYGSVGPDETLYAGTQLANPVGYGASKGGLRQVMRYLATSFAPAVRVNMISPGGVERGQPEAFQERYRSRTPLGRMAVEEDVKGAVAYLASDLSAYVTGHELLVDGGWTAW